MELRSTLTNFDHFCISENQRNPVLFGIKYKGKNSAFMYNKVEFKTKYPESFFHKAASCVLTSDNKLLCLFAE